MKKIPKIFVVSAPSGSGKNTIVEGVLKKLARKITKLPTYTTRKIRAGEKEGIDYFFISKNDFQILIKNKEFLEYILYSRNYYGTSKTKITKTLNQGQNIILVIDVNGAKKIKQFFGKKSVLIFIDSKLTDIKKRLQNRGANTKLEIENRLKIAQSEIKEKSKYDFVVNNPQGNPEQAIKEVVGIIRKNHGLHFF